MAPGINGKMNEVSAAFGLLQLKHIEREEEKRKAVDERYRRELAAIPGLRLMPELPDTQGNFSYFAVLVGPEFRMSRDALYEHLRAHRILSRRYFYPLVSEMPMYRGTPSAHADNLPVATRMTRQVLCLPIHADLTADEQSRVIAMVRG